MVVVDAQGYDGVNIDWEGSPVDVLQLATELRARLGTRLLSADALYTDSYYWARSHAPFDRVNIMTYDMTGAWNPYSWHNAALYDFGGTVWSVNKAVNWFAAEGTPREKLNIGIPFYGWLWTGGVTGPTQPIPSTTNLKQVNYNTFVSQITPQRYNWDAVAKVPYLSFNTGIPSAGQFLTYDNELSITDKIQYAQTNHLGGWIIWNLQGDYLPLASEKHPLLKAVKDAIVAAAPAPPVVAPAPPVVTPAPPEVTPEPPPDQQPPDQPPPDGQPTQ
jgi:chitinase